MNLIVPQLLHPELQSTASLKCRSLTLRSGLNNSVLVLQASKAFSRRAKDLLPRWPRLRYRTLFVTSYTAIEDLFGWKNKMV